MSSREYRLDSPLLAIERRQDSPAALRVLAPGTEFIVLSASDGSAGLVEIAWGGQRLEVFRADLESRSSPIAVEH